MLYLMMFVGNMKHNSMLDPMIIIAATVRPTAVAGLTTVSLQSARNANPVLGSILSRSKMYQ